MPEQDLLTVDEAAEFLRISRAKLFELIRQKDVPFFRIGRDPKFPRRALMDWMDMMAWQTVEEGEEAHRLRDHNIAQAVAELKEFRRKGVAAG